MKFLKVILLSAALALTSQPAANAAVVNVGTLTPQHTENVFSIFSAAIGDDYLFTVTESFAFTSIVDAYDTINFGISLSDTNGFLFAQDSLAPKAPITGFNTGTTAEITEKILGPGDYTFSIVGNSTDTSSAVTGSFTVGRAAVAAVPEPATYAMFLAGLGLLGFANRKRV